MGQIPAESGEEVVAWARRQREGWGGGEETRECPQREDRRGMDCVICPYLSVPEGKFKVAQNPVLNHAFTKNLKMSVPLNLHQKYFLLFLPVSARSRELLCPLIIGFRVSGSGADPVRQPSRHQTVKGPRHEGLGRWGHGRV